MVTDSRSTSLHFYFECYYFAKKRKDNTQQTKLMIPFTNTLFKKKKFK